MNNNIITITEEPSTVVTVPVNSVQADLRTETGITVYVPLATRTSPGIVKIGDGLLINPTTGLLSLDKSEITVLGVKVNGTALIPDENKYVNISVPTKTSDLTNDGDGESPYATEDYVWHYGGAVNGLILNDVTQTIDENKMIIVNIDKTTIGLGNVDNTSDADKPISTAVNDALSVMQNDIDSKLSEDSADVALMDNLTTSVLNDNVTLTKSFINLKTQVTSTDSFSLPLATDQTGGLMSSADYSQIRNNTSRIEQLEGQTKRLLYTDKTNPTAQEINAFVTDLGYTSPFSGIAVVVDQTFHIWHYYTNTSSWKDDGLDTVSQFTNSSPGVILGSATDGKVYAETDGTGSVYGWDTLTNRVSDLENNMPTDYVDLTSAQTITAEKNFQAGLQVTTRNDYKWGLFPTAAGAALQFGRVGSTEGQYNIYPLGIRPNANNQILGHLNRFKRINVDEIASTHDGTSAKVQDIIDGTFNVINASDIASTNILTEAQIAIITNGKPTIIKGTFRGYTDAIYKKPVNYGTVSVGVFEANNEIGGYIIQSSGLLEIRPASTTVMNLRSIGQINGKQIPAYPTDLTKDYVLHQDETTGALRWTDTNTLDLNYFPILAPSDSNFNTVASTTGVQVDGNLLGLHRPILFNSGSNYRWGYYLGAQKNVNGTDRMKFGIYQRPANQGNYVVVKELLDYYSGTRIADFKIDGINSKTFPAYPTDTTKQYKLAQNTSGNLVWAEDDTSGYVTLDTDQTITGQKTFLGQLKVKRPADDGGYFYVNPDNNGHNVKIGFSSGGQMMIHNGGLQIDRALYPMTANANIDLGTSSILWNNLYLKGALKDGTNSLSVAQIAAIKDIAEGKTKSFVIDTKSQITGTEDDNHDFTNVTAITGVTIADLKLGDIILIKELEVSDYWVSELNQTEGVVTSVSLYKLETSKVDLSAYYTKTETDNLLDAKANDTDVVHLAGAETITGKKTIKDTSLDFQNSSASGNASWQLEEDIYGQIIVSRTYNNYKETFWEYNGSSIVPKRSEKNTIGSATRVLNGVFSKSLSDGTNSVSIANIADKSFVDANYVSVNAQTLTEAQKAQVRQNIGAGSVSATTVVVNGVDQTRVSFDSDPQTQITDVKPVQISVNTNAVSVYTIGDESVNILNFVLTAAQWDSIKEGTLVQLELTCPNTIDPYEDADLIVVTKTGVPFDITDPTSYLDIISNDVGDIQILESAAFKNFDRTSSINRWVITGLGITSFDDVTAKGISTFNVSTKAIIPVTSDAGKVLMSTSTEGEVEWGTIQSGGVTDAQVNGTSVVINGVANILTNTAYDASTNKIATMSDIPDVSGKMDKANPTGTGSLSLNRKAGTTVGSYSVAEGYDTEASGYCSHAEGFRTRASSYYSHAEGNNTIASEYYSHAEGHTTEASGFNSHAEGNNTIAQRKSQHVFGEYNVLDTTGTATTRGDYVEIVGNGSSSTDRSNARTLDWNGNEWLAGKLTPAGGLSDGKNANYKLLLPDTTNWTADKTIATTDAIPASSTTATPNTLVKRDASGNIVGNYLQGTWLQTTGNIALGSAPSNYAVLSNGWIYSRTLAQTKSDLGITSKYDASNPSGYLNASGVVDLIYPVGSIYLSINNTSPATLFGGTWLELDANRALWVTATSSNNAGTTVNSGLPNITGGMWFKRTDVNTWITVGDNGGALYGTDGGGSHRVLYDRSSTRSSEDVYVDASRSNSIYGSSSIVQPPAYRVYAWRRTA